MARKAGTASNWRYEHHKHALMPWPLFLRRAVVHVLVGGAGVAAAVLMGTVGYHLAGGLHWVDAFLNASMILAGMGPVDRLDTTLGKLFAAFYALFSGLVFIALMGVVLAPWAHRVLHRMHMAEDSTTASASGRAEK